MTSIERTIFKAVFQLNIDGNIEISLGKNCDRDIWHMYDHDNSCEHSSSLAENERRKLLILYCKRFVKI